MSVRVFEINGQEIIAKLKVWAEKLSRDKNVLAVVLFGSLINNEATPASDADILILLKESKERFDNRIPQFKPVQYYNLLLYKYFYGAILKSNPLTPYKMGALGFSELRNIKK